MAAKYTPIEIAMRRLESSIYKDGFRWDKYSTYVENYYNIPIKVFYGDNNIRYVVLYYLDGQYVIDKIMIFRPFGIGSLRWMADPKSTKVCDRRNCHSFGITNELFYKMSHNKPFEADTTN